VPKQQFDYTTLAHRFAARFPLANYVSIQITFWIAANLLMVIIMHFTSRMISETFRVSVTGSFAPLLWIALALGIGYGVTLGLIHYYLDQRIFRKMALGKIIVLKTLGSLCVIFLLLASLRYIFFEALIEPTLPTDMPIAKDKAWKSIFWLLAIYYFFMTLLISFINQVNRKYGPGILLPLLLGRYREPKEEDRIFMFMDLKSSTATAEALGHLRYSAFIRDCFADINEILYQFRAQVYQYVGDEMVLTWPEYEGIKNHFCIEFFFACKRQFRHRSVYYMTTYGQVPEFKAGVHTGTVTAVEIGEVKRDIAYHGDTLHTAARIQHVCNEHGKSIIVSKVLLDKVGTHPDMKTQALGMIALRGKAAQLELVSVDWKY
jgi:adenylate cyclase